MGRTLVFKFVGQITVEACESYDLMSEPPQLLKSVSDALDNAIHAAACNGFNHDLRGDVSLSVDRIVASDLELVCADPPEDDVSGFLPEHTRHRYSRITCPKCEADLTAPGGVLVEGGWQLGHTRFSGDGAMQPDDAGLIFADKHCETRCSVCQYLLTDYEV